MFNLFFRRYVPGFRVGLDGVPGFNIDDNGLPQRASASSDGTLPDPAAQWYPDAAQTQAPPSISFRLPGAESWVLSAPLPGFRVSPQDVVPGFNVGSQDDAPGLQRRRKRWPTAGNNLVLWTAAGIGDATGSRHRANADAASKRG